MRQSPTRTICSIPLKQLDFDLGISTIQSGEAKIQFLDHLYRSEKISGYGAIAGFGVRLGIFEFLLRKSISEYNFEELSGNRR